MVAHWFIKVFCESKFYPLYSMLFGMGLVLQRESVVGRGRNFTSLYLRRLFGLFLFGVVHAFGLWYGDILLVYSFAGLSLLVQAGRFRPVTRAIASAGRMGLTCYLLETLLVTGVMYWWGLGLFGTVSPAVEVALTLAVYATVVLFSMLWLRVALFGPLEWIWRWWTYLRRPSLLRGAGKT